MLWNSNELEVVQRFNYKDSLENGLWLLKYAGRPTLKNVIEWRRKTVTDVITPQTKGERRGRGRELQRSKEHIWFNTSPATDLTDITK